MQARHHPYLKEDAVNRLPAKVHTRAKPLSMKKVEVVRTAEQFTFNVETTTEKYGSNGQVGGSTKLSIDQMTGAVTVTTVTAPGRQIIQPSTSAVEKAAARVRLRTSRNLVFENVDLVALLLSHTKLTPKSFVWAGRVSKTWRAACRVDSSLLLKAAKSQTYLTKREFEGLFCLGPSHGEMLRRGAFCWGLSRARGEDLYIYPEHAIDSALYIWAAQLARRAANKRRWSRID